MEVDLGLLFSQLSGGFLDFLDASLLFRFVKFFLFVYVAVLFVDIVLLFWLRDVTGDLRATLRGGRQAPLVRRGAVIKRWEAIQARLESESESQYKAAVLEADAFADEILKNIGYAGANMQDRLDQMQGGNFESKSQLEAAHTLRNRIVNDPGFQLELSDAREAIDQYGAFFREIELFS